MITNTAKLLRGFLQELFRLVNFGGQVRASAAIRMVQEHQLSMIFPYLVFRERSLTISSRISSLL